MDLAASTLDRPARHRAGRVDLSVVLVSWNMLPHMVSCLRSIFASDLPWPTEVVVVDNNSSDNTPAAIREQYPAVYVIENLENAGFARAVNQGVKAAAGKYVLLLNPDTVVNSPSLQALVAFMQHSPDAAIVGGTLLNSDGSFQASYSHFSTVPQEILIALGIGEHLYPGYPSHHRSVRTQEVDWMCGACLLVLRDAFLSVGGLDEEYVMYSEEVDLQYRLRQKGWKAYYIPQAHAIHHGGASQGRLRRRRAVYRGKLLFYRKNRHWFKYLVLRFALAAIAAAKFMVWTTRAVLPWRRDSAIAEAKSNLEILRLCVETA